MKVTRVVIGFVIVSGMVACGPRAVEKHHHFPQPKATAAPQEKAKAPSEEASQCPTSEDKSLDPNKKVQRQTVKIQRVLQRTIVKNCAGDVVQDKIGTIESPVAELEIKPVSTWLGFRQSMINVYNRTKCSGPGAQLEKVLELLTNWGVLSEVRDTLKSSVGFPSLRLKIDTSPSLSHMHVGKYENYIDYEFGTCEQYAEVSPGQDKKCSKVRTSEAGTLILTVEYSETTLPGLREVVDCKEKEAQK